MFGSVIHLRFIFEIGLIWGSTFFHMEIPVVVLPILTDLKHYPYHIVNPYIHINLLIYLFQ